MGANRWLAIAAVSWGWGWARRPWRSANDNCNAASRWGGSSTSIWRRDAQPRRLVRQPRRRADVWFNYLPSASGTAI